MPAARDLAALPKAHLHLDGAMRPGTPRELAAAGIEAPLPTGYGSFAAFTATITAASRLRTPSDVDNLVDELVDDAAAAGVRCSVNADDPLLFGTDLLADYGYCRAGLDVDDQRLAGCARTPVETSAAPPDVAARTLAGIDAWLAGPGAS